MANRSTRKYISEAENLPPVVLSTGTNNYLEDPNKYYHHIDATVANLINRGHQVHIIVPHSAIHNNPQNNGPSKVATAIAQKYNLPTYNFEPGKDGVHPRDPRFLANQIDQRTNGQAKNAIFVGDSIAKGVGDAAKADTSLTRVGAPAQRILSSVGGPPPGYNNPMLNTVSNSTSQQGQSNPALLKAQERAQQTNPQLDQSSAKGRPSAAQMYSHLISNGATENEARMLTSAGMAESGLNPNATHDRGTGYGMFGHNMRQRLDLRGQNWQQQASSALDELRYSKDSGIARARNIINDPRATAHDLTVAQMHYERPRGYTSRNPTGGDNWSGRLANTKSLMNMGTVIGAAGGALAGSANANNTPTGSNSIQNPANNDISKMKFSDDPGIAGLQRMQAMGITGDVNDQLSKANEILKGVTAQQIASDPNLSAIANLQQGLLKTSQVGKNIDQPSGNDQGGTTIIPKTSDSGKITDRLPTDDIVQNVLDPSKGYAAINPPTSGAQNNNPYKDLTTTFNKGVDDITNTMKDKYNSIANGNTTLSAASQSNTSADDLSKRLSTMGTNIQQQVGPAFKDLADKSQDFYNKELAPTVTDTIDKINKNAPALIQKGKDTLGPSAVSAANKALDALSPSAAAATPPNNGSPTSIDMGDMWKKTQANGQAMLQQGKDKLLSPGLKSLSTPGAQASIPSNGGLPQSGPAASTSSNSFSIDPKGTAAKAGAITPDGKLQNNWSGNHSIDAAKMVQQHPDFNTLPPGVQSHVNSAATGKTNLDLNVMQPHFGLLPDAAKSKLAANGVQINVAPPQQTAPASPVAAPATQPAPSVSGTPTRTDSLAQKVTDPVKSYSDINPITPKVELPKVELPKVELPPTPKVELPKVELPKVELPPTPKVDTVPPPEDNKPADLPKQPELAPAPASPIKSSSDNYSSATAATDSGTSAWTPGKGDPGDKTSAPTDEADELDKLLEQYQEFKFVY
jgi:hypothetical protein